MSVDVALLEPVTAEGDTDVPHVLYRAFDAAGVLLYVGISLSPAQRFATHEREKPWWVDVALIRLEHFQNRELALLAEEVAIRDERPVHNVVHNRPTIGDRDYSSQGSRPRIDPEVAGRLEAYCRRERRNATTAVNLILDQELTKYEAQHPPTPEHPTRSTT